MSALKISRKQAAITILVIALGLMLLFIKRVHENQPLTSGWWWTLGFAIFFALTIFETLLEMRDKG